MNKKNLLLTSVTLIIIGAISFYGGIKYSESKKPQNSFQRDPAKFQGMRQGGGNKVAGGFVSGEIIKKDDKSVTLKLSDGGSKIIYFSDATSVSKSVDGTKDDMEIGKNVMVNGSTGQDGSIVAQSVQIRPITEKPSK